MSTLLSLDPGTRFLGWAFWEGGRLALWGLVEPDAHLRSPERIGQIRAELDALFTGVRIHAVACERAPVMHRTGGKGAFRPAPALDLVVNELRFWAKNRHASWAAYNPAQIKSACAFAGNASKEAVARTVKAVYGVEDDNNVVDAIAVGHCHLMREGIWR